MKNLWLVHFVWTDLLMIFKTWQSGFYTSCGDQGLYNCPGKKDALMHVLRSNWKKGGEHLSHKQYQLKSVKYDVQLESGKACSLLATTVVNWQVS